MKRNTEWRLWALSLAVSIVTSAAVAAQTAARTPLSARPHVASDIRSGEMHTYDVVLAGAQLLYIAAEQKGIDVKLTLIGPHGKKVAEADSPDGASGIETLVFRSDEAGSYTLEVTVASRSAAAGRYAVLLVEIGDAAQAWAQAVYRAAGYQAEADRGFAQSDPTRMSEVIDNYTRSLDAWRESGVQTGEALALYKLGIALTANGERRRALGFFERAIELWKRLEITSEKANSHNWLCGALFRLGKYQEGFDHARAAYDLYRANSDRVGETEMLMLLGNFYVSLGTTETAIDQYNAAVANWRSLGNMHRVASTYNSIGIAYSRAGDPAKGFTFFQKAVETYRADRPGTRGEANALNQLGFYYLKAGELDKAATCFNEALPIWKRITDAFGEPVTLLGFGRVAEEKGDRDQAVDQMNRALALARARGMMGIEPSILHALAKAEFGRERREAARQHIEAALAIVESTRAGIVGEQFRTGYLAQTWDLYDLYIDLLMQMHAKDPGAGFDRQALEAAEAARARGLTELLIESSVDIRHGVDPALLQREYDLNQKISAAEQARYQMMLQKRAPAQIAAAEVYSRSLLKDFDIVQADIRARSPRYAAITQPKPIKLSEIQNDLIGGDTLLLVYWLGSERSYLWAVSDAALKSYVLPKKAEIEAASRELSQHITLDRSGLSADKRAKAIGDMLIGPAVGELGSKRLVVTGDGLIQSLPFAAFSKDSGRYLVEDHEIAMLPSAKALAVIREETRGRADPEKLLAVFADPVFSRADPRIAALSREPKSISERADMVSPEMPRLPGSRREARSILALVPTAKSKASFGFDADRRSVTGDALSGFRYVHFATHGVVDTLQPERGGLILSMFDRSGRPQDGFLRLHDIYNLRLPAELVVLSACESGLGRSVRGEGIVGLTRGFMYAGAKRVVVSLWRVDDVATSELMRRFYSTLVHESVSPAAALRSAQISMLREKRWRSPYFWSSFVLQGEWK